MSNRSRVLLVVLMACLLIPLAQGWSQAPMKITWVPLSQPVDPNGDVVKWVQARFNVVFDIWNTTGEGAGLDVRLASGEIPDRMEVGVDNYQKYVDQGLLAEMPQATIQKYAPNLWKEYSTEEPEWLSSPVIDGKNYGLLVCDPETGGSRPAIVYRGDWLKAVGIARTPTTLAEFQDAVYKFTKNDPDKNGKNDTYGFSESMLNAVYGAFGYLPIDNPTGTLYWGKRGGKLVAGAIQPEMKDALKLLRQWYADGVIDPEFVSPEDAGAGVQLSVPFAKGIIGVSAAEDYIHWKPAQYPGDREGETIQELRKTDPSAVSQLLYGLPPVGPNGQSGMWMYPKIHPRFVTFGKQVQSDPAKMAKILQILDYTNGTIDGFTTARFGVEGKEFTYKTVPISLGRIPVPIGKYDQWANITQQGGGICFSAIWIPSMVAKVNAELWWRNNRHPELDKNGYVNALFVPTASYPQYGSDLVTLVQTTYTAIIRGDQPLDSFDQFVQTFNSKGGDILATEANAQMK